MEITVYTAPDCAQSMMTKRQFDKLNVRYTELSLAEHPGKKSEFETLGHINTPVVTTDRKIWSGFQIEKIASLASYLHIEKVQQKAHV